MTEFEKKMAAIREEVPDEFDLEMLEKAKAELRAILEPLGTWESDEQKIRYYMDLAERDKREGII